MKLAFEVLEPRDVPAGGIVFPGTTDPADEFWGHFSGHVAMDHGYVAQDGGSDRVEIFHTDLDKTGPHDGAVLLNVILTDPNFRGGGQVTVVDDRHVLSVPGPGGGPVVTQFDFDVSTGVMAETSSFFAPYDQAFRGGLYVSSGPLVYNGSQFSKDVAFFLPGEGGGPQLTAVDLDTHDVLFSIWVGDPADLSGSAQFTPDGGTIQIPGDPGLVGIPIQYAAPSDGTPVTTRIWAADGHEIPSPVF